jgi:type II secretory pathway component PulJ
VTTVPPTEPAPGRPALDAGVSLVELIVAIALFSLLGTLLLGVALSTRTVTGDTQQLGSVGEETRVGMERLTRELRQAARLTSVQLPVAANDKTRFTLWADFNGNKCIDGQGLDPEQLTYVWDPTTDRLTLTATVQGQVITERVLAANVSKFDLDLRSSAWQYDSNQDGITTWQELDDSSIGNQDPQAFTPAELQRIDLVGLSLTATDEGHSVGYSTQVNLRNQNQDVEMRSC